MQELGAQPTRDPLPSPRHGRGRPGGAAGMVAGVLISLGVLALIAFMVIHGLGL